MSSTNRGAVKEALDFYATDSWIVHRFLEAYPLPSGLWLEPCAGDGAIIKAVNEKRSDVAWCAIELDPSHRTALQSIDNVYTVLIQDARELLPIPGPSVILSNPPFYCSTEILLRCLAVPGALTVLLQKLNWCGGPRSKLFREIKPSIFMLPQRPGFVEKIKIVVDPETGKEKKVKSSQDSVEYGFWVFDGLGQFRVLEDTPIEIRSAQKKARLSSVGQQLQLAEGAF